MRQSAFNQPCPEAPALGGGNLRSSALLPEQIEHRFESGSGYTLQFTCTDPVVADNAPYLEALVASSLSAMLSVTAALATSNFGSVDAQAGLMRVGRESLRRQIRELGPTPISSCEKIVYPAETEKPARE